MTGTAQRFDGLALSLASLGLCLLLLQDAFLNPDAYVFLAAIAAGESQRMSALHPLYPPIAELVVDTLQVFGVRPFYGLEVVSALSVAVAVFFFHRTACLLETSRLRRNLATALFAATPSVVFFGTVIENIALLLAFASAAWWLALRCLAAPSLPRAVVLGGVTALGSFAHATGNLLPLVIITFAATLPRASAPLARWILLAATLIVAHTAASMLGKAVLGAPSGMAGSVSWLSGFTERRGLSFALMAQKTWEEWLLPYLPLSVLVLVGFARPGHRLRALVLHAIVAGYLAVAYIIIPGMWEYGSYGLPSALLATTAVVCWAPTRVLGAAVAVSLTVALGLVAHHDGARSADVAVGDVMALAGDDFPLVMVGSQGEYDVLVAEAPDRLGAVHVFQMLATPRSEAELLAAFDTYMSVYEQQGTPVYLSRSGLEALRDYGEGLLRHIEEHYRLERRTSGAYEVFAIRRR